VDIEALVTAAKEIVRKADLQEARSRRYGELAAMARKVQPGSSEHRQIQAKAREIGRTVVDFGDAINDLRAALRDKGGGQ
jgi:hypothetical protein